MSLIGIAKENRVYFNRKYYVRFVLTLVYPSVRLPATK